MAEKSIAMLATLIAIVGLLVGGIFVYAAFPREVTITKEVTKEVKVPVEVINTITVPLDAKATYLDTAIADFLSDKLENLTICGKNEYDEDQIKVSKVYEDWAIVFSEDKHNDAEYRVDLKTKLKYLDSDVEEKCYKTCNVSVLYRQDKDPKVSVSC